MDYSLTKKAAEEQITAKLSHFFGVTPEEANYEQFYKAIAMITRDMLRQGRHEFEQRCEESGSKRVYYMCMEFLMGRSLKNTLYNLNLIPVMEEALKDFGIKLDKLYDCEPDAGLGNGGLGRLAACYLDALATDGYLGMGYSILYEYGIFKQKLVDGWQTEMPDFWLPGGEVWLVAREEKSVDVSFEGNVVDRWEDGYHSVDIENAKKVHAVPYDMMVAGKDGKGVSVLRLWSAKSSEIDMNSFNQGDYLRAMEQNAMAEVISKVLYPADNHPEGKSLRLRQQYFLVSASVQDIINRHLRKYGSLDNLCDKMAIHINDTHPTLAIPELMRLLLDECGYSWDDAWDVVTKVFAYTNHTVMSEALECWSEDLFRRLLPRIYQIVKEIDNRFRSSVWEQTRDAGKVERMAVISNGVVRMANLCVACCHSVNGVSALHSEILKDSVFHDFYTLTPDKFCNVTNGIAHRRWLCQANPRLTSMLSDLIGGEFVYNAECLSELAKYKDNPAVLAEIEKIKTANKADFAKRVKAKTGIELDPNSIFDVQVKRLHEYKRQLLCAMRITQLQLMLHDDPDQPFQPRTFLFAAKAAPGYATAKRIIQLLCSLAADVNADPVCRGKLQVYFLPNYRVSAAEMLMPAAQVSEQISTAGKEASGTGNMKLMMNGAVTIGTLDGANVEMFEQLGADNMFLFGLHADEAEALRAAGYDPQAYVRRSPWLGRVLERMSRGYADGESYADLVSSLLYGGDPYLLLADFDDYAATHERLYAAIADSAARARLSLVNIARSGIFAADRAVREYAERIWEVHA